MVKEKSMNKAADEVKTNDVLDETLQEYNRKIDKLGAADKANAKAKKRLKRKVAGKNIIIGILVVIIIILLLRSCGANESGVEVKLPSIVAGKEEVPTPTPKAVVKENPKKQYVTLPVSGDFSVSSTRPNITLYCPVENKDLFEISFTFLDKDGNVIYQSDFEDGGKKWDVNFKELLPVGENEVKVKINSQYCSTKKAANGSASDIVITVNK